MPNSLSAPGLHAPVTIRRDAFGIAHIEAANERDAWFAQGFASAQDRLWQMEYDRLRAVGRWSEAAGPAGLAADKMARRLGLERAAKSDLAGMCAEVRAMFDAYAEGVNAFLAGKPKLPPEYALTGISPEPWEAWHSLALFKIRHILMGLWQWKVAAGGLLARVGPETWRKLQFLPAEGTSVIMPPGEKVARLYATADAEIAATAEHLGFLAEVEAGSNSWVVSGSRTTTGKPVICNDSHRAVDVPNAYWQVHVSCPEFNVAGATFAGFPGFPHFGFNGAVAWNITHTQGDYQDLCVEQFEANGERYLTPGGWQPAERETHTIRVRGAADETIETWRTRHGPIVHGDPRTGLGMALRYTANEAGKKPFDGLRATVMAATVDELFDAQRTWVDPVNNLVAADATGNIGFMVRGELPVRSSKAARRVAVPGWTGEHEWVGTVPFEQMPRSVNPPRGFFATANQRVLIEDEPYISAYYANPARADRLVELLGTSATLTPEFVAGIQGDTVSLPARAWAAKLASQPPFEGDAERARAVLAGWDGDLRADGAAALVYAFFRRAVMRELFESIVGADTWTALTADTNPGQGRIAAGLMGEVVARLPQGEPPSGASWANTLQPALERAWRQAVAQQGADPSAWRWDAKHHLASKNPLSPVFPSAGLDLPEAAVGGDGDTVRCAGYGISGKRDFVITLTSVYRQVVDFADTAGASYVIPGGASGDSSNPHFADQLPVWANCERVPMNREPAQAKAAAAAELRLEP